MIHPTAIIDASVSIPQNCQIGPFCVVEAGVRLAEGICLDAHVVLKKGTILQNNVHVHAGAIIGDDPQISGKSFNFESGVYIGECTEIREGVTIHRASEAGQMTKVGSHCLLMAFSHVGHDTIVGNHCIIVNNVLLAGCVTLQDYVFMSGGSMVHQFVHIGESAFVSGNSEVTCHIPPFVTVLERNRVSNLNIVGLKRRGFTSPEMTDIKTLYREIYDGVNLSFKKKAQKALEEERYQTEKGKQFLQFFLDPKPERGFVYPSI